MHVYMLHCRSTAQGIFNGCGRIGAILANIMFGYLMDVGLTLPVLVVAIILMITGIPMFFTPSPYRKENLPPIVRGIMWLRSHMFQYK